MYLVLDQYQALKAKAMAHITTKIDGLHCKKKRKKYLFNFLVSH